MDSAGSLDAALLAQARGDARAILHGQYRPAWYKHALWPWARTRYTSRRHDASCDHVDCQCIWCRCGAEPELETRA